MDRCQKPKEKDVGAIPTTGTLPEACVPMRMWENMQSSKSRGSLCRKHWEHL